MADFSCPGAGLIKQPQPETIKCSHCGEEVEIWSDEAKAKCSNCGKVTSREMAPSCIEWCDYAKLCLGEETYERYMQEKVKGQESKVKMENEK